MKNKEPIKITGEWRKRNFDNITLVWIFRKNNKIIHKISDYDLRAWLYIKSEFDYYDLLLDGTIRKRHTDIYIRKNNAKIFKLSRKELNYYK